MILLISQKSLGNQKFAKPLLSQHPIDIPILNNTEISAKQLLINLVTQQVKAFNQLLDAQKLSTESLTPKETIGCNDSKPALIQQTIDEYLFNIGKVDVANIANFSLMNTDEAIVNVLQSFQDGLFMMFVDDKEIKSLSQNIEIYERCHICFVKLAFLTEE